MFQALLKEKYYDEEREIYFYSYFFSLEQILFLIDNAKKESISLGNLLDEFKNISCSTGDFYADFDYIHNTLGKDER